MKSTIIVCALLVLACLCLQAKAACEFDGVKLKAGEVHYYNCTVMTCHADGSFSGVGCGLWQCSIGEQQIDYKYTDLSKPYPECCPHPICAP